MAGHFQKAGKLCIFIGAAIPMKYYNRVFDIFLYEGAYIFLFSWLLFLLDDRYTDVFFKISIGSLIIAGILGALGRVFNLFAKEDDFEES